MDLLVWLVEFFVGADAASVLSDPSLTMEDKIMMA